jgi:hypothetical protein
MYISYTRIHIQATCEEMVDHGPGENGLSFILSKRRNQKHTLFSSDTSGMRKVAHEIAFLCQWRVSTVSTDVMFVCGSPV